MTFSQSRTHAQSDRLGYDTLVWQISAGVEGKTLPQYSGQNAPPKAGQHLHAHRAVSYVGTSVSQECAATTFRAGASSETLARQCVTNKKTTVWIFIAVKIWNLMPGCTKPGHHVVVASKLWTVAPNICGSSTWNLLHVSLLAPKTRRWLPRFWKVCAPLIWL